MSSQTDALPLIRTKLYRPPISGELVPRPCLVERLDRRRDRPLTLISAPASYGKTTLISSWLETCDCPSAWLSLDEEEDDLVLFLTYLLATIEQVHKGELWLPLRQTYEVLQEGASWPALPRSGVLVSWRCSWA